MLLHISFFILTCCKVLLSQNVTADPADKQLPLFKKDHEGPIGVLTTSVGAPVEFSEANESLNISSLINNEYFMDEITHFDRERIPERVVHAKGGGAKGYFIVTRNITGLCKAELFNAICKRTPVSVRFSSVLANLGGNDMDIDARGFAVKFYTKEGNWDFVGLNTPMFQLKDPLVFPNFIHSHKRNPATNFKDSNMFWDFISLQPETLFQYLYITSGRGLPYSYRYMPGFSIHTYQVENSLGELNFLRFHFIPDLGIKDLPADEAREIGADDPDHYSRDLYNAIEKGNYPTWKMYIQVVSRDYIRTAKEDVFDVTRVLNEDKFPLQLVGELVLNKNPVNFFTEIEEIAFCPGNLVPGITGAPDKVFQARRLSYRDTQYYRLGANFHRLPINCPYRTKSYTYLRDGRPTFDSNGKNAPNYYPNSFYGPIPIKDNSSDLIEIKEKAPYNFDQAAQFLDSLNSEQKDVVVKGIVKTLGTAERFLQERIINYMKYLNKEVGEKLDKLLVPEEDVKQTLQNNK